MPHAHAVILAGTDPRGPALADDLRGRGWTVWPPPDDQLPGLDRDASLVEALHTAALIAVLTASELTERAAVKAALDRYRGDRTSRRVVPVGLPADLPALTGLAMLQAIPWDALAADTLHKVLLNLRADDHAQAEILLLAHPAEVSERDALRTALHGRRRVKQPVELTWLDTPDIVARARAADLVLLVLGYALTADELPRLKEVLALPQTRLLVRDTPISPAAFESCADFPLVLRLRQPVPAATAEALITQTTTALDAWLSDAFPTGGAARLHPWEQAYLEHKVEAWTRGHHTGMTALTGGTSLTRAALYVPAKAGPGPWKARDDGTVELTRPDRRDQPDPELHAATDRAPPLVWLDALLSHPELPTVLVIGEAGSGKTVLLQHVAATIARHALGQTPTEPDHLDLRTLSLGAPRCRVPILIEARRIAARLGTHTTARAIASLIAEEELSACGTPPHAQVQEGFTEGRYLLLIDARDEVPADQLPALDNALRQLVRNHPKVRVIVSTRPSTHTTTELGHPFISVPINLLDDDDRAAMIKRWCAATPTRHHKRAEDLPATLRELGDRVGDVADDDRSPLANPLFFTCALLVYELDGQLPDGRADLYDKLVEVLCRPRGPTPEPGAEQRHREIAIAVAQLAQAHGSTALPVRLASEGVADLRRLGSVREAELQINAMAAHTMLWRFDDGPEGRVIRPWHRSFQEHLAARAEASAGRTPAEVADLLSDRLHEPTWSGTVRFLPGAFVWVHTDRGLEWFEALATKARAESDPRRAGHLWALTADAVAEERGRCFHRRASSGEAASLAREVARVYAEEGNRWGWQDRLLLLDGLGRMATRGELGWAEPESEADHLVDPRLEDPRISVARWVDIPGGRYRLGDDPAAYNAGPARTTEVPRFWLLDTPVTAQDLRPFIDTEAILDPRWRDPDELPPKLPPDWHRQRRHPNRPACWVTWWDAIAFCRWASTTWRLPEGGVRIALPTAAMWEAAARGKDADLYPWGNQEPGQGDNARAAHSWGGRPLRGATSVGGFPAGRRGPLLDLAGNVWEWTDSPYSEDGAGDTLSLDSRHLTTSVVRRQPRSDVAPRVVRGGSWRDRPGRLRAAGRVRLGPGYRNVDLGFRVCVVREPGR
jgi:formylglycine-generating enzyme required for sulfatase activity